MRDYKAEYKRYGGTERQKKRRAARNLVRRRFLASGRVKKGDGKDIDHKDHDPKNSSPSNLRVVSASKNRGYQRDAKNKPISRELATHIAELVEFAAKM